MDFGPVICRYAQRFAAVGDGGHHVGSALGAWLVLALAGPTADGAIREQITDALGVDVESARRFVADLVDHPHPAVGAALAAWTNPSLTGLDDWRAGLPSAVSTGAVPTQRQADAWARENTLGLIDAFPVSVADTVILLASALATRVTWRQPFDLVDADQLGGPWGRQLGQVLHSTGKHGHQAFIAATPNIGDVAVHTAFSNDRLSVTSVIAAPDIRPANVLAVAHDIARSRAVGGPIPSHSLFDLPLGAGPLWTITERDAPAGGEHVEAVLPAWHAESQHDLLSVPTLGLATAGQALSIKARVKGSLEIKQTAVAAYTRRGFEAAAVTGMAIAASAPRRRPPGPYRTATLRFAHPYAVVATTRAEAGSPWAGLPVFAAWITRPDDAPAD